VIHVVEALAAHQPTGITVEAPPAEARALAVMVRESPRWGTTVTVRARPPGGGHAAPGTRVAPGEPVLAWWGTQLAYPDRAVTAKGGPARFVNPSGRTLGMFVRSKGTSADEKRAVPSHVLDSLAIDDILRAHVRVLEGTFAGPVIPGQQVRPGVWLGPRVTLARTAELVPPVFVGDAARIEKSARVGPVASIGARSVVGADTEVDHSIVGDNTLLGSGLWLLSMVAVGDTVVDLARHTAVAIADAHILSPLGRAEPAAREPGSGWGPSRQPSHEHIVEGAGREGVFIAI
jgi:hypothetical protein